MKSWFLMLALVLRATLVSGQVINAGSIWYLGNRSGFDFGNDPPTILSDGKILNQNNRSSTVTDERGDLLLYTNGDTVWNNRHRVMENGVDLNAFFGGNPSTSVIVPHPGDGNLYYILTANRGDENNFPPSAFAYAVIDVSTNGGEGRVLSKNVKLLDCTTTLLTVISHAMENSFWALVHEYGNNKFYAYQISEAGITEPVVSSVGPNYHYNAWQLKASPDGTKLGVANHGYADLYDFNSMTGLVSNHRSLGPIGAAGVEFSPNSDLLYFSTYETIDDHAAVYQFDVRLTDVAAMQASKLMVGRKWKSGDFGDLQLAGNGKIYVALNGGGGADSLVFIDSPNNQGLNCGYTNNGIVPPVNLYGYLPQSIQSYYRDSPSIMSLPGCVNEPTQFNIASLGYADSLIWDYGDGHIERFARPGGKIVQHSFSQRGEFTVKVKKYIGNISREIISTATVSEKPYANLGKDTILCAGEEIILNAGEVTNDYSWSNGSKDHIITIKEDGQYHVQVSNGVCTVSDTINVRVLPFPQFELGQDKVVCDSDSAKLFVSEHENFIYKWSSGEESSSIIVRESGHYSVTVSNDRCAKFDEVNIKFASIRNLRLEPASVVLEHDENLLIFAEGSNIDSWEWSFGDGFSEITVVPQVTHKYQNSGHYEGTLRASSFGCIRTLKFEVEVPYHLFIPNVITPNNDGKNDFFELQYNGTEVIHVVIYNRWGEEVFSTNSLENRWDGSNLTNGTYFYAVTVGNDSYRGCLSVLQ